MALRNAPVEINRWARELASRLPHLSFWLGLVTLAVASLAALYCWFWVATIGLAFGPRFNFWYQLAGVVIALATLVGISRWMMHRADAFRLSSATFVTVAVAWTLIGAALWYALSSPFARHVAILAGFAATTWWMLWTWMMFLSRWRFRSRALLLVALIVVACSFFVAVRADGLDGDALPRLGWRFASSRTWPEPLNATVSSDTAPGQSEQCTDSPRFRGARGAGVVSDVHLARDWQAQSPKLRWRRAVGPAWSSFAVAGSRVYTQEQRGAEECVTCYDRATGRELWVHADAAHYENASTGDGPRATPTVDGDQLFSLGATGLLNALDATTGKPRWTVDLVKEAGAAAPIHGFVGSPLVLNNAVVVCAGGAGTSLVAYDRSSGSRLWAAGNDAAGYTSPLVAEFAGQSQIVTITTENIHGHNCDTGRVCWSIPFGNEQETNCSQPVAIDGNHLFASTNYGTGCTLIEVGENSGRWTTRSLWTSRELQTKFSSPVVHNGHAYGFDDGILECVTLANGGRRWKRGRYGHGQLLLVGDLLLIQAEDGRIALVAAQPESFTEWGVFPALEGKTWNYPALAGGELFVRNDRDAACFELPLEAQ